MPDQEESSLQAFYRLCIMVGAVVVGGMAFRVYGPPVNELPELAAQLVEAGREALQTGRPPAAPVTPRPAAAQPVAELQPMPSQFSASAAPDFAPDSPSPPAAGSAHRELSSVPLPEAIAPMIRELRNLGAVRFRLAPWGNEGDLQRFECKAPLPGASGLVRHFDSIQPDATIAAARVYEDVRRWRAELASSSH